MAPDDVRESSRLYILVAILFAASFGAFLMREATTFEARLANPAASPPADTAGYTRIAIDFGDGTKRAFRGRTETGATAMVVLRAAQAAGGFRVETDDRGVVVAVGATRSAGGRAWWLYQNGVLARDVPGRVVVAPGDTLTLRYE